MKTSTLLISTLAAMATATPRHNHQQARRAPVTGSPSTKPLSGNFADMLLARLKVPHVPPEALGQLTRCLREHKTYVADFGRSDEGMFSVRGLEHVCCEMARAIWAEAGDDGLGEAVFNPSCDGLSVSGVSRQHIGMAKVYLGSL